MNRCTALLMISYYLTCSLGAYLGGAEVINSSLATRIPVVENIARLSNSPTQTASYLAFMWTLIPPFTLLHVMLCKSEQRSTHHRHDARQSHGAALLALVGGSMLAGVAYLNPSTGKIGAFANLIALNDLMNVIFGGAFMSAVYGLSIITFSVAPKLLLTPHNHQTGR